MQYSRPQNIMSYKCAKFALAVVSSSMIPFDCRVLLVLVSKYSAINLYVCTTALFNLAIMYKSDMYLLCSCLAIDRRKR